MIIELLVLLALSLIVAMALYKYVWWKIGRDLEMRAALANDPEVRHKKITELSTALDVNPADTEALLMRSSLYFYEQDYAASSSDLEKYLEIKPGDSEAWAELAENRLRLGNAQTALMAAERAVGIDGEYADYHALVMRCCLKAGHVTGAKDSFQIWRELDEKRLRTPSRPHRWSRDYQMPDPELTVDPAITLYGAALLLSEGKNEQAAGELEKLRNENPEYYKQATKEDPVLLSIIPEEMLCVS